MNNINWRIISNHIILLIGVVFMSLPVWVAFSTSTHSAETILREGLQFWPGTDFLKTYKEVMFEEAGVMKSVLGITMLKNSMILGIGFAVGKVIISMLAAYAIVYFRFRLATPLFWIIFLTQPPTYLISLSEENLLIVSKIFFTGVCFNISLKPLAI